MQSKVTQGRPTTVPAPPPDKQVVAGVGGSVTVSSSALPSGAATEATLAKNGGHYDQSLTVGIGASSAALAVGDYKALYFKVTTSGTGTIELYQGTESADDDKFPILKYASALSTPLSSIDIADASYSEAYFCDVSKFKTIYFKNATDAELGLDLIWSYAYLGQAIQATHIYDGSFNLISPVSETTGTAIQDAVETMASLMGNADPLAKYKLTDEDLSSDPQYTGYVDKDGNWYILQHNMASGTWRYNAGTSAYATAWTNRAGASYDYFSAKF